MWKLCLADRTTTIDNRVDNRVGIGNNHVIHSEVRTRGPSEVVVFTPQTVWISWSRSQKDL